MDGGTGEGIRDRVEMTWVMVECGGRVDPRLCCWGSRGWSQAGKRAGGQADKRANGLRDVWWRWCAGAAQYVPLGTL